MPAFSKRSRENLSQCHPDLQRLFNDVIQHFDCSVICGHRGMEEHNHMPSMAVDVVPYPLDWDDRERFGLLAGFVQGRAIALGINIRWGGDWDQDNQMRDETFLDMPHYELMDC